MLILQVLDFSWESGSLSRREGEVADKGGWYRKVSMTVCGIIACLDTSCVGGCIMRSYEREFVKCSGPFG